MTKVIQQIGAVFLSMLIMLSTVSLTVDVHVCAGEIVDISLTQEELSCSSSLMGQLSEEAHDAMRNMGCCDDLVFQIDGQDELQLSHLNVEIDNLDLFAYIPLFTELEWISGNESRVLDTSYIPPPLIQDIQVLHQTFLL